ncbi:MAG TPA: hypothetical protein VN637_00150, partial [Roseiarcus sp.]|nr:hypothetical protein [Roseiarcus sp.]
MGYFAELFVFNDLTSISFRASHLAARGDEAEGLAAKAPGRPRRKYSNLPCRFILKNGNMRKPVRQE